MLGKQNIVLKFYANRRRFRRSASTLSVNMHTPIGILPILTICRMYVR